MSDTATIRAPKVNQLVLGKISLIAGLGGLLYGYDMGIIAAALLYIRTSFALSTAMSEVVVSVVLIGAMAGALIGGAFADARGRRLTLLAGGLLFLAGSAMAAMAGQVLMLIVARMLLGIAIGFTSVTAPVYVSELAPPQTRGRLIGLYQFALTIGIACADLVGYYLAENDGWRKMFLIGIVPSLVFLGLVIGMPESPRWLMLRGRRDDALSILSTFTDKDGVRSFELDIATSMRYADERKWSKLWTPAVRRALAIAVGFTVLQQITGINTILYYGPTIFSMAGYASNRSAILATFCVASINVAATVVALVLVDRIGRKPLLYAGISGMAGSLFVLAASFHMQLALGTLMGPVALTCLIVYITCFAFSMGPIAWIIVAEVFPLRLRGRGVAAATLGSGIANFIVSMTFLSLLQRAGSSLTFCLFGAFCIVALFFVLYVMPETRGHALESISREDA